MEQEEKKWVLEIGEEFFAVVNFDVVLVFNRQLLRDGVGQYGGNGAECPHWVLFIGLRMEKVKFFSG